MDVQSVLMGDPGEFHIAGGANPFTRTWWGSKKYVNRFKAIEQWKGLYALLVSLGVKIHVLPASHENPGLVYPANYGVRLGDTFVLSNLLPTRAGEVLIYEKYLKGLGLQTARIRRRFEGEAEFFPVGSRYVFTYGAVKQQRFKPKFALPPWTRVYGFRTEHHAMDELRTFLPPGTEIVDFELIEESHYHGDTVFCSFGPNREYLMAYLEGILEADRERCRRIFKENLIVLSSRDGFHYAANSFQVKTPDGLKLIVPEGVSETLLGQIREKGVEPMTIDVSEFLKKGGGAVKCMIGDLGNLPQPPP